MVTPAVSVIIPLYNAQNYLERFTASLQAQTCKDFEAIFIDDASTDASASMITGLASADSRFTLLRHSQNRGAGAARNTGIRSAKGKTICFADPDDFLPENSLQARYQAFSANNAIVRACHHEISPEGAILHRDTRPAGLPEVFRPRDAANAIGINAFVSAHWAWLLPTKLLQRQEIFNEESIRTAEDIMLLVRLFFKTSRFVWIPDVVYYWMKRENSLSTSCYTADHYLDYFKCCEEFYAEAEKFRAMDLGDKFYDEYLTCYIPHFLKQCLQGKSTEADAGKVMNEAVRICGQYGAFKRCFGDSGRPTAHYFGLFTLWRALQDQSPSTIQRLANGQNAAVRRLQTSRYDSIRQSGWQIQATFDKMDKEQGLMRARYMFCDNPPEESFTHNGTPLHAAFSKNRLEYKGNGFTIFERILWLPVPDNDEGQLQFCLNGKNAGLNLTPAEVRKAFTPLPLDDRNFPPEVRALRKLAKSESMRRTFKDAWLFIDKDTEADDNAEHLYRWVKNNHPEINAWFVLSKNSHDWKRLQAEGFKLIDHGSDEHKVLFILCKKLISSHMDRYIFAFLDEHFFTDLRESKFVCLPHGVTKDDVSGWFNNIPFDAFISATPDEKKSIVEDGSPYVMTEKEVHLCGLPRYDQWMEPVKKENIIFIMPTWRADLVGAWDGKGQKREINPNFYSSSYVHTWQNFLNDQKLEEIATKYQFRIIFFAHPCFADYLDDMPFPSFVEKRSKVHGSIGDIMKKSSVMITDFSSVAYDMAYMKRPVIYYQSQSKDSFTKSQRWVSGYIDYETMGFGPVCNNKSALLNELEKVISSRCVMEYLYAKRAEHAFPYRHKNCCKETFKFTIYLPPKVQTNKATA